MTLGRTYPIIRNPKLVAELAAHVHVGGDRLGDDGQYRSGRCSGPSRRAEPNCPEPCQPTNNPWRSSGQCRVAIPEILFSIVATPADWTQAEVDSIVEDYFMSTVTSR